MALDMLDACQTTKLVVITWVTSKSDSRWESPAITMITMITMITKLKVQKYVHMHNRIMSMTNALATFMYSVMAFLWP